MLNCWWGRKRSSTKKIFFFKGGPKIYFLGGGGCLGGDIRGGSILAGQGPCGSVFQGRKGSIFLGGAFFGGGGTENEFFGVVNEFWGGPKKIFLGG